MRQRRMGIYVEFFESQDPKRIERIIRKHFPKFRNLLVGIDHKSLLFNPSKSKKARILARSGQDVIIRFRCENCDSVWEGMGIADQSGGYWIFAGTDVCRICRTPVEGEIVATK